MTSKYSTEPDLVVDLRSQFPGVRDQGPRPLCLAFAASDFNSAHNSELNPLSVEYLAYHAYDWQKQTDFSVGLNVPSVVHVLETEGQPIESDLPYDPNASAPKKPATIYPKNYFVESSAKGRLFREVLSSLDSGIATVLCIDMPDSFFSPPSPAVIVDSSMLAGRHAIVAIGYGKYPDGEICLLIRNSWGTGWADGGHAWLTADLVHNRLLDHIGVKN